VRIENGYATDIFICLRILGHLCKKTANTSNLARNDMRASSRGLHSCSMDSSKENDGIECSRPQDLSVPRRTRHAPRLPVRMPLDTETVGLRCKNMLLLTASPSKSMQTESSTCSSSLADRGLCMNEVHQAHSAPSHKPLHGKSRAEPGLAELFPALSYKHLL